MGESSSYMKSFEKVVKKGVGAVKIEYTLDL